MEMDQVKLTQLQKLMVFTLSMSLYGLSNMAEELLPAMNIGPLALSAEYFAFIPLVMCMLFDPFYTAIGAAIGEVLFGGVLAGRFSGFGELEQFISLSLGLFVAGSLVRDPKNRRQIVIAALTGAAIQYGIGSVADIQQVLLGMENLSAVPGLVGILLLVEIGSFAASVLISGMLFGLLPVLFLVPLLNGKAEPMLGMKARGDSVKPSAKKKPGFRMSAAAILFIGMAFASDYLYETGFNLEWQANFVETFGNRVLWLNLLASAIVAGMTLALMAKQKERSLTAHYHDDHFP
jgi:hypothetical protein